MQTEIKTLADFKRLLTNNVYNPSFKLSSKIVLNGTGEVIRENAPAQVAHIQSNQFAVDRNGNLSWMEFGKAGNWLFDGNTAKHNVMGSNPKYTHIIFTIHAD
jgi:hypothetical protein